IARDAFLAEGEKDFAVGIELDDLMPAAVGYPDVAVAVDHQVMREEQHAGAEALEKFAAGIELQYGRERAIGAGVGATPFGHPDVAVATEIDGTGRAPGAAVRHFEKVLD